MLDQSPQTKSPCSWLVLINAKIDRAEIYDVLIQMQVIDEKVRDQNGINLSCKQADLRNVIFRE